MKSMAASSLNASSLNNESLTPKTSSTTTAKTKDDLCDICERKDGFQGMILQKCSVCGICVHEACYGLVNHSGNKKFPNWICHACDAIGKPIKISKPYESPTKYLTTTTRPTECALCTVTSGIHAMHLLYDQPGSDGTPVVLSDHKRSRHSSQSQSQSQDAKQRVAWVHTLCAMFIGGYSQTRGCVYGCTEDGRWEAEDSDDNDDDDDDSDEDGSPMDTDSSDDDVTNDKNDPNRSKRRAKSTTTLAKKVGLEAAPHHFVIASKENDKETLWTNIIREMRNDLKCFICGRVDRGTTRIAVQCDAMCEHEHPAFRVRHVESHESDGSCFTALHVGCARWGKPARHNRVYFFPGREYTSDDNDSADSVQLSEIIVEAYCDVHAQDIELYDRGYTSQRVRKRGSLSGGVGVGASNGGASVDKRKSKGAIVPNRLMQSQSSSQAQISSLVQQTGKMNDSRVGTSTKGSSTPEPSSKSSPPSANSKNHQSEYYKKKFKREQVYGQMLKDMEKEVKRAQEAGLVVSVETKRCKAYWKEHSGLTKGEFSKVWKQVKEEITSRHHISSGAGKTIPADGGGSDAVAIFATGTMTNNNESANQSAPKDVHADANDADADAPQDKWSWMWVPHYRKPFDFSEWDSMEEISPEDVMKPW